MKVCFWGTLCKLGSHSYKWKARGNVNVDNVYSLLLQNLSSFPSQSHSKETTLLHGARLTHELINIEVGIV